MRAALGQVTNYDGRLLSTVRKLFLRPGHLALDHVEGRRAQHLDPFRIFVLANVAAWLIVPHTGMKGFSAASRGWRYVQHLVFAARFYCIQLCCVLLYIGCILRPLLLACKAHAPSALPVLMSIRAQHMASAPALMLYLFFGMQRA